MQIKLSTATRRKLGSGYAPRKRHPDEAEPARDDLFARPLLVLADFGPPAYVRPGADVKYPSLSPFAKD
jgi:hypothetical protein